SDRLVEFPLGLFGIALATVILPNLSRDHAANDKNSFSQTMDWSLRWVIVIALPATLGLFVLAEPILAALFQNDEFSHTDVQMAGRSLKAYSLGLAAFMMIKVLVPGFSSRQDLKNPVRYGLYAMVAKLILNIVLVFEFAHAGLAFATSLAAFLNAWLLVRKLMRHGIFVALGGWPSFLMRVLIANGAMGAVLSIALCFTDWFELTQIERLVNLGLWIGAGALVYAGALFVSGLRLADLGLRRMMPS
ncbi:MAG: murein biosynthesis integral membrane protein MurJ, partial [Methylococcales bacterium]